MEVIFNKKDVAKIMPIRPGDPYRMIELRIKRRENSLKKLGEFLRADSIEYIDCGYSGLLVIRRGEKITRLTIYGSRLD